MSTILFLLVEIWRATYCEVCKFWKGKQSCCWGSPVYRYAKLVGVLTNIPTLLWVKRGRRGRSSQQAKAEAEEVSGVSGDLRGSQRKWVAAGLRGNENRTGAGQEEDNHWEGQPWLSQHLLMAGLYRLWILRSISKHNNNECLAVTTLNTNNKLEYLLIKWTNIPVSTYRTEFSLPPWDRMTLIFHKTKVMWSPLGIIDDRNEWV